MAKRKSTATATPASKASKQPDSVARSTNLSSPPTRSSKRLKTAGEYTPQNKSSPLKSKYFEHSDDEDEEESAADSQSGYEDEDVETEVSQSSATESESEESVDEKKAKKKGRSAKGSSTKVNQAISGRQDLWREGVKTGLGPGKAVFIEKPKARGDGGIPYKPESIHPNTLEFLKDLKKNNDREWLKAHDPDYRASWKDFESFVETLSEKIAEIDDTIPELPPKDLVFRIYRDVRFSSDPTPYKPHFSAAFSRTGRKGPYACYYIHIQPGGKCFVGSGLWHPDSAPLALVRADIDQQSERIRNVLTEATMRKHIFGGVSKDAKKAVQAFCKQNQENALKTKPKGYDAEHPNIELLRLRNFTIGQKISDEEIFSSKGLDRVLELVTVMKPFVGYLNSVVMPDAAANEEASDLESSSSSDDDA